MSTGADNAATGGGRVELWFSFLCAVPWLLILTAYVEAAMAWAGLERWPRPSADDPKQLATAPIHVVWQLLVLGLLPAVLLVGVVAATHWEVVRHSRQYSIRLASFSIGIVVVGLLSRLDPGRVWVWLAD